MRVARIVTIAAIGIAALPGSFLASQTLADADSTQPSTPPATTAQVSLDTVATQAAAEAALVQMCRDSQHNPDARTRYATTAAAHPETAQQIGPDCVLVIGEP